MIWLMFAVGVVVGLVLTMTLAATTYSIGRRRMARKLGVREDAVIDDWHLRGSDGKQRYRA